MRGKRVKRTSVLRRILLVVYASFSLFPIIWMILTSFKREIDIAAKPSKWIFNPTLENYRLILHWETTPLTGWSISIPFLRYATNSLIITICATSLVLIIGIPVGYYLARYRTKVASNVEFWILSTRMAPPIVFLISYFFIFVRIGLYDTLRAVILMSITLVLPLCVWMMRSFFAEVPQELEQAARIDGCSNIASFFRITLPLASPGLAATAILCGIFIWNDLLFGLALTAENAKPVPVAVLSFVTFTRVYWGQLCASGTIAILPMLIFIAVVIKHIVRGLTFGALRE